MTPPRRPAIPEIYMRVKDPKHIERLLVIQNASRRQLARAAGYRSHSYVNRILNGEITNVTPERAARIARFLQVGVDDLFVARLSTDAAHPVRSKATA